MQSSLNLDPPPGYEPADGFDGFVRPSDRASIVLRQLPAPMADLTAGFEDPDRAAEEGLELLRVEAIEAEGRAGKLFVFARGGEPDPWHQWTLALGDGDHTALVTAVVPAPVAHRDEADLRAALGSVSWAPGAGEPFEGLGFRVDVGELVHCRRVGEMVMLGDRDPISNPDAADAAIAVGRSTSQGMRIVNRERFAIKRLNDQVLKVLEVRSHGAIEVAGLHGFRTVAEVESLQDAYEDQRRLVAQVVLFPETDYFVVWVETDMEDRQTLERFEEVVHSFVRLDSRGEPVRDEVAPPKEAAAILDQAFELTLHDPLEDATWLADRLTRTRPELDPPWAAAYVAEALFLRQSVESLASIFDGEPGTPFHLETALRMRYPGYDEATYGRAQAYSEQNAGGPAGG